MRRHSRKVVPYIGTWIETSIKEEYYLSIPVVPYIGTWIETPDGDIFVFVYKSYLI